MAASPAAHRLALSGPEWVRLCRAAGMTPPPGFGPDAEVAQPQLDVATGSLVDRGVLTAGGDLHPSVAVNLAIWASPVALVRAELAVGERGLRAVYVLRGPFGGSLFTLDGGGVELSLFAAAALGRELGRCVPDPADVADAAAGTTVHAALGQGRLPGGRLPLLALAGDGFPPDTASGASAPAGADAALAAQLAGQAHGVLQMLAVSGTAGAHGDGGAVLVGEVVWLLTAEGWVGLRPQPDGTGRQLVDIVPVDRAEIGSWLAPYLARILEGAGG